MAPVGELSDLDVLVVDCQTTGATPSLGAVLELGWGVLRPSRPEHAQVQAHWITLPEGHSVPRHVRRLTGFDERRLTGALAPNEAWHRLRASVSADKIPTVIHFARFELVFLRDWASRFEPEAPFPLDAICVHAVACRLYPDLPRRSIRALAGYLGHGLELRRSSLGHVEATAFIWRKLSAELEQRGVRTWAELHEWLTRAGTSSPRSKKRRYPLASARYRELPDEPGVYRFLRANGDVLYVGKARSLKKRVTSHFAARSTREHALEMLTQVSDVQVSLTPTPLEAAVLENESIKSLHPPYNLQLIASDRRAWFATPAFDDASNAPDDMYRIGPLPSALSLRALGSLIALASGARPTLSLRARALGVADRWAPDEPIFAAGFADFTCRQLVGHGWSKPSSRREVLGVAKRLVWLSTQGSQVEEEVDEELEPDDSADTSVPATWDPERVARHLERALGQAYRLLRRAAWLRLLHDSVVVYQEPVKDRTRLLVIRGGDLAEARDLGAHERVVAPPRLGSRRAGASFGSIDRATYDRLRVLSSELKRVRRDGGRVAVYVAPGRRLGERILDGIFDWI